MITRISHHYFTPEDDVKHVVDTLPTRAMKSLDIEIYGLTDMALVDAVISAAGRGVKVRVMNDRSQAAGKYDQQALQAMAKVSGITIRIVESVHGAIDHLKNIIIDGEDGAASDTSFVGMGSYNFSDGAQKQDNFFHLSNDPGLVAQAMAKFELDWKENISKPEWQMQ